MLVHAVFSRYLLLLVGAARARLCHSRRHVCCYAMAPLLRPRVHDRLPMPMFAAPLRHARQRAGLPAAPRRATHGALFCPADARYWLFTFFGACPP